MLAHGEPYRELRRGDSIGQAIEDGGRINMPRQDLEQPRARIEGVVEAVPALLEKRVPAHLAGERCADFLHLALDQRMPGLPQERLARLAADPSPHGARQPLVL